MLSKYGEFVKSCGRPNLTPNYRLNKVAFFQLLNEDETKNKKLKKVHTVKNTYPFLTEYNLIYCLFFIYISMIKLTYQF